MLTFCDEPPFIMTSVPVAGTNLTVVPEDGVELMKLDPVFPNNPVVPDAAPNAPAAGCCWAGWPNKDEKLVPKPSKMQRNIIYS